MEIGVPAAEGEEGVITAGDWTMEVLGAGVVYT